MTRLASLLLCLACLASPGFAEPVEAPRIVHQGDRSALLVEGKPFFIFGGQMGNSSNWPATLPRVWQAIANLHANTLAAPIYWEQLEPSPGAFDFAAVDRLVREAREHQVHLALLWFGASKNGQMHYAPLWVKTNTTTFPRLTDEHLHRLDVLDPDAPATLAADRHAYVALLHHLREIDGAQHTVILMQVENEAGPFYADRSYTEQGNQRFAGQVPAALLSALGQQPGTWQAVFGPEAADTFATWSWVRYLNNLAEAGKAELNLPTYVNIAAINTPTEASVHRLLDIYKAGAPAIDIVAADLYDPAPPLYEEMLRAYSRPPNPLWISETGSDDSYARFLFSVLGRGGIGFSPFGIDFLADPTLAAHNAHVEDFRLLAPMAGELAALSLAGKLTTVVEDPQHATQEIRLHGWEATITFGYPQADRQPAPGTPDAHGRVLLGELGPDEFVVTGVDARVSFHLPGRPLPEDHHLNHILRAEQGDYLGGVWHATAIWNGDETQRGLNFLHDGAIVHVRLYTWPGL